MLTNKKRIPWNKGKKGLQKWSFETREKMKNRIPWNKGTIGLQKFSDTTKEKMSKAHKGKKNHFYGKKHTKETKQKLREINLGKKLSEKTKRKIGKKSKGNTYSLGLKQSEETKIKRVRSRLGYRHSLETRIKIGKKHKGKNHWNWQGGLTSKNTTIRNGIKIKLWRESVFAKDNWTCQKCSNKGGNLNAHHIKNFAQYPKLRFNVNNGITLCKNCHLLEHNHKF